MKKNISKVIYGTVMSVIIFSAVSCKNDYIISETPFKQIVVTGLESPESVIKLNNRVFVSNMGVKVDPASKDSDGSISELSSTGTIVKKKFQNGILHSPKGLAILGNTIYVTDIDRIVGFDLTSGNQVFEYLIAGNNFLNDLAVLNNSLVASGTLSGNVYQINTQNNTSIVLGNIIGANGLTWDSKTNRLYAVGAGDITTPNPIGKFYVKDMNLSNSSFMELANSPVGTFDAVELIDDTRFITDDYTNGNLFVYDFQKNTITTHSIIGNTAGTADLYYDKSSQLLYVPIPNGSSLIIEKLSNLR